MATESPGDAGNGPELGESGTGLVVVGLDGVIRFATDSAERLLGRPLVGQLLGVPVSSSGTTRLELVSKGQSHLAIAESSEFEWNGDPAIAVTLSPLRDIHDWQDWMRVAGHELRSPLGVILGTAETLELRAGELTADTISRLASAIFRQARRLDRLVARLLARGGHDHSMFDAVPEPTTAVDALRAIERDFGGQGIEIALPPEELTVLADPDHLQLMLSNLVENAVKYGAPPIEVTAASADERVSFTVRDHGAGVRPEFVPRLFEAYARDDSGGARGLGLGLALVRGLAQGNGGDVTYEQAGDGGACFRILLPRAAQED